MAGRKRTRARINNELEAQGQPPLANAEPIPQAVLQARAAAREVAVRVATTVARQTRPRQRPRTQARPRAADVGPEQIKSVLRQILMNDREPGAARINAAKALLELDGTAPEFQKYVLELRLSAYTKDQALTDRQNFEARP